MDNTVKSLNPEAYGVLEQRLMDVNSRISELKQNARSLGELASDDTVNGVLLGNLLTKGAELFGEKRGNSRIPSQNSSMAVSRWQSRLTV